MAASASTVPRKILSAVMARKIRLASRREGLLTRMAGGDALAKYRASRNIFRQVEPADSVSYLGHAKAKLALISKQGEENLGPPPSISAIPWVVQEPAVP